MSTVLTGNISKMLLRQYSERPGGNFHITLCVYWLTFAYHKWNWLAGLDDMNSCLKIKNYSWWTVQSSFFLSLFILAVGCLFIWIDYLQTCKWTETIPTCTNLLTYHTNAIHSKLFLRIFFPTNEQIIIRYMFLPKPLKNQCSRLGT